jgi:hypothetical protein
LLTRIVEQPLLVEADRIGGLNFHRAFAAAAGDPQHMPLDFRQFSLPHPDAVAGAGILEQRIPVFVRKGRIWSRSGRRRRPGSLGGRLLFSGRHAPACGSVSHVTIRT